MGQPCNANFVATAVAFTITLTSLASSVVGVGRQSTMLVNIASSEGAQHARVYYSVTTGVATPTTPITPYSTITFYLLQGDAAAPNIVTDAAGASDAGFTVVNAPLVHSIQVSPQINGVSGTNYQGSFIIKNPGPYWGIAVVNSTGVALSGTNGSIKYNYESIATLF